MVTVEYGSYTQAGIIRKIMTQIFILERANFWNFVL